MFVCVFSWAGCVLALEQQNLLSLAYQSMSSIDSSMKVAQNDRPLLFQQIQNKNHDAMPAPKTLTCHQQCPTLSNYKKTCHMEVPSKLPPNHPVVMDDHFTIETHPHPPFKNHHL